MKIEVKEGIYWVGAKDWSLRNFHGYETEEGSTYNAFLIVDEKITLIDTVKSHFVDNMLERIEEIVDPKEIDYIVLNHAEMDHSGAIMKMKEIAPKAEIIVNEKNGERIFRGHFHDLGDIKTVSDGEVLNTGKYNLTFIHAPMTHWPETMYTYIAEQKILFSSDAFGQHYSSPYYFDDEAPKDIIMQQLKKYYGNIIYLYGKQVLAALEKAKDLDIEIIAPDHGVIWRTYIPEIVQRYTAWAKHETKKQALIIYDTMWNSTKALAREYARGIENEGMLVTTQEIQSTHISDIITEVVDSKLILIGCPTLNNGIMPTMGSFLTYLKGLRPERRIGFAFGSYGWGGQSPKIIYETLESMKWKLPLDPVRVKWVPTEDDLKEAFEMGSKLAKITKEEDI